MSRNVPEPARHLSDAAELVRAFNHASISTGDDWQYPSHSCDALGNLAYLLRMLPQAIEQAVRPALHTYEHNRLAIDNGGDPDQAVRDLTKSLEAALQHAARLAAAVDGMHSATSPMAVDTTGLPEPEDDDQDDEYTYTGFCHSSDTTGHRCAVCAPHRHGGETR